MAADAGKNLCAGTDKGIIYNIDSNGNEVWKHKIKGACDGGICQTPDGKFTIAGSWDTVHCYGTGGELIWISKITKKNNNDKTREIAEKICRSLKYGNENQNLNVMEFIDLISVATSAVDFLDSYMAATTSINNRDHNSAYEFLMKGIVSEKMIDSFASKIRNTNVINDVKSVNEESHILINNLMEKEKDYYETESKKDADALQSMIAYERLSEMYGILGNEAESLRYLD
jgi:hypothetical protein